MENLDPINDQQHNGMEQEENRSEPTDIVEQEVESTSVIAKSVKEEKNQKPDFITEGDYVSQVFFLRGYPRSGTNWLCNLINLHPAINCIGEFHLEKLFNGFRNTIHGEWGLMKRGPNKLRQHFLKFIEELVIDYCGGAPHCGDRTPLPMGTAFIPGKKYLYITRDGRDCIVSWAYHVLKKNISSDPRMKEKLRLFNKDPQFFENNRHLLLDHEPFVRKNARNWNKQIIADLAMLEKADKGEFDFKYYWVKFEDLHKNVERIRNEIYQFIGVNPEDAKPLTIKTKPGFEKVNTTSHYRKGAIGDWENYFTKQQLNWFVQEAQEALELLEFQLEKTPNEQ